MVLHSDSEAQTPPPSPPPHRPLPPLPPQHHSLPPSPPQHRPSLLPLPQHRPTPSMINTSITTGLFPSKLHNFAYRSLNNHYPNRFRFNRLPLPEAGGMNPVFRLGSSPLNPARSANVNINHKIPVLHLGSSIPNPTRSSNINIKNNNNCSNNNNSLNLESNPFQQIDSLDSEKKLFQTTEWIRSIEGSERRIENEGKSKFRCQLPLKKRLSGSGYALAAIQPEPNLEPEPKAEVEVDARANSDTEIEDVGDVAVEGSYPVEPEAEDDNDVGAEGDANFCFEDGESNQLKANWNLRPKRLALTKRESTVPTHGSRFGVGQRSSRRRNGSGFSRVLSGGLGRIQSGADHGDRRENEKENEKEKEKGKRRGEKEKEVKRVEFSLSLTKEEIEEDFIRMTGAKPPKKPTKRTRAQQKHLDKCFPGLWLTSVTPDMYRVPDPPLKG